MKDRKFEESEGKGEEKERIDGNSITSMGDFELI